MRFLSIFLMCAAAFAQPTPARVSGRVVDQSGNAVRRATMKLLGPQTYTQLSDDNGMFAIDNVTPGRYSLIAQRPGYSTQKYGAATPLIRDCANAEATGLNDLGNSIVKQCIDHAPGTTLVLASGQAVNDVTVKVFQQGSISGRLTGQDGDALQDWGVQALRIVYLHGVRQLQSAGGARSDADGAFAIGGLPSGRYYLRAANGAASTAALIGDSSAKPRLETDLTTYYPSQADESRATPLDLTPGSELHGIDILARRSRVYSIRGVVSAPQTNEELSDQILSLVAKGTTLGTAPARVRSDASFEFRDVEPGTYTLRGGTALGNRGVDPMFGEQEITIASTDIDGLKLTLGPGADVTGTITVEGTGPTLSPYVMLQQTEGAQVGGVSAQADAKGSFHLPRKLAPVKYSVVFPRGLGGVYVKSMRFGNQDVLHGPLDLSGGGGSIDIVLSSKVAAITGSAPAGVVVSAWPRIPQIAGGVKVASADQNGHFEISDLGPGDYFVAAWEDIDPGLLQEASFVARFQNEASAVTLEEGGHASADTKVIARDRVAAEVAKLP